MPSHEPALPPFHGVLTVAAVDTPRRASPRRRPGRGDACVVASSSGANSGIGLEAVLHLARLGFHTIGAARSEEKAEALATATRDQCLDVETRLLDVTEADGCARVTSGLELYGLVNNAGYYNVGAVEEVPDADARRQLDAMVLAPIRLARLVLPGMRRRGEGRIVNMSSTTARVSGAMTGWYQASKHALSAVTDALRIEVASFGVDVVLIEPGTIRSAIWGKGEDDILRRRPGSPYAPAYDRALRFLHALQGVAHPPSAVAAAVGDALTTARPGPRYRVGLEAGALEFADVLLPTRAKDRIVRADLRL